jgi:hypothetical protein
MRENEMKMESNLRTQRVISILMINADLEPEPSSEEDLEEELREEETEEETEDEL